LPSPILQLEFRRRDAEWNIESVRSVGVHQLKGGEEDAFAAAIEAFNARVWRKSSGRRKYRYDLAVLVNENEKLPPSDPVALKRFIKAVRTIRVWPSMTRCLFVKPRRWIIIPISLRARRKRKAWW